MHNTPPPPPPKLQLPPNWEQIQTGNPGEVYYWNRLTNETSWERPLFTTAPPPPPRVDQSNTVPTEASSTSPQILAKAATTYSSEENNKKSAHENFMESPNSISTNYGVQSKPQEVQQSAPGKPSRSPPSLPSKPKKAPPSIPPSTHDVSYQTNNVLSSALKPSLSPSMESIAQSKPGNFSKNLRKTITSISNLSIPGINTSHSSTEKTNEEHNPSYPKWLTANYHTEEERIQKAQSLNGNFLHNVTFDSSKQLYREAALRKINRDGPQKVQFFLFNDSIAYADIPLLQNPKKHYELRRSIEFSECEIEDTGESDKCVMKSPQKTFVIVFTSTNEKNIWLEDFKKLQEDYLLKTKKKLPTLYAPLWVENKDAISCHNCKEEFGLFGARHHCRNCGNIFCLSCCNEKTRMPHIDQKKLVRTCVNCYKEVAARRTYAVRVPTGSGDN